MMSKELQEIISPTFDDKILHEIFKKSTGANKFSINNIKIKDSATNKGDSYLSSIVRFSLEGTVINEQGDDEDAECHVIVKVLPKNIARRISFRSHDFFKNEVAFYHDIWEALLKFQKSKNLENPFINIPTCYAAVADGENDFIALEDLNSRSFSTFKRQGEMNYDTVVLIIRLFARFHALSFAFKDQRPDEFNRISSCLQETYFHEKYRWWYVDFHNKLIATMRDAVEKQLSREYLEKFDALIAQDFYKTSCDIASGANSHFSMITQGDSWVPNFLCKYDSTNLPIEIKLIDFQLARCTSPATDIMFFLYACTSFELLSKHWDDIFVEYHRVFCEFLTELGSSPDIFKFEDFKVDLKRNAVFGMGMAMESLPFQMMDDSETADLDAIQGDKGVPITSVWKVHPIENEPGRQRLANVVKHAVDHGFI